MFTALNRVNILFIYTFAIPPLEKAPDLAVHIHGWEYRIPGEAYFKSTIGKLIRGFRGFGRDANVLVFLTLLANISGAIFGLAMSLYLLAIGYSLNIIGLLMGLNTLTIVVTLIPFGKIADRYGSKWLLVWGSIAGTASIGIFISSSNLAMFALANILSGLSSSSVTPTYNALLSEKSSKVTRNYLFTLNAFSGTLGQAVGMLFGGFIPSLFAFAGNTDVLFMFKMMFFVSFLISAAKSLGFIFVKEKHTPSKEKLTLIPGSWSIIKKFAFTNIIIGFGAGLVIPWFQIYFTKKFGVSISDIGYLFAIQMIIMAISILLMPALANRTGSVKAIVITQAIAIVVLVMIPNTTLFLIAAIAFIIRAILMNIANPIQNAYQMSVVRKEDRASSTAISQLCWTSAWSVGTIAAGYVMNWDIDAPFFITAAFYTAYVILFYIFFRKIKEDND